MKRTRIVISSYDDIKNPYYAGGGARAVHETAKRLAQKSYAVTVITGRYPGSKNQSIDGVTYERTGTAFLGAQMDQLTFQLCLPFHVLTKKFDIWMESFTPPFSTTFLQLFTRKPVIGLVHMLSGEDMKRKYKLPFDVIEHIGIQTYKYIIVTSEFIKRKISLYTNHVDIVVIPNGIASITKMKTKQEGKYLLFLGRIEVDQKGLDLLLYAYKKIADTIQYPLYIAGAGETKEEEKLKKLIASLSLKNKVKLLGRVEGAAKEKVYQEAFCVVLPARFETFSLVALEAMAQEKAVIHFAIEGMRWIPKECSITVKEISADTLAEGIQQTVKDKIKREKCAKAAQTFAANYTWDTIATRYDTYIQKVVKNR